MNFNYEGTEEATCLQLAIDGQRLCRNGDIKTGVHFFESALKQGTNDLTILTVVYSQLGNAYFSLRNYIKSLHYHRLDLDLSRRLNDISGEAKACGNLGNTLKMLGKYDEALTCCEMHLKLAQNLNDQAGVARALYNLANVYHQKAKSSGAIGRQDLGQFPLHIQEALEMAAQYYDKNLDLCVKLGDRATQGLACGNLANTHYLLGNFQKAVELHSQRLEIAKEFGHRAAERRAYSNRGNAYIFLANFEGAIEDYRNALRLAQELNDETLEAQVCYSLGNTYYIVRRYDDAAACLEHHLRIAKQLDDKVGEARAYWSLTNIHSDNSQYQRAKFFASLHLQIASEMSDSVEVNTAKDNLGKLELLIQQQEQKKVVIEAEENNKQKKDVLGSSVNGTCIGGNGGKAVFTRNVGGSLKGPSNSNSSSLGVRSVDNSGVSTILEVEAMGDRNYNEIPSTNAVVRSNSDGDHINDDEDFFSLLSRFQSRRMDEQRCSFRDDEEFLELVAGVQGSRMDDQRATMPPLFPSGRENNDSDSFDVVNGHFPGLRATPGVMEQLNQSQQQQQQHEDGPSDALLEMIARCQAARINDQRSSLPQPPNTILPSTSNPAGTIRDVSRSNINNRVTTITDANPTPRQSAPTVPDEDLMALISRLSSYRLDEQRCSPPFPLPALSLASTDAEVTSTIDTRDTVTNSNNNINIGSNNGVAVVIDDSDGLPEQYAEIIRRGSRRRH